MNTDTMYIEMGVIKPSTIKSINCTFIMQGERGVTRPIGFGCFFLVDHGMWEVWDYVSMA